MTDSGGWAAPAKRVTTPCIGVCSTSLGDTVCRGCKRFAHEIIAWNSYSEGERLLVVRRLQQLLASVVANRFQITDIKKFSRSAKTFGCELDGGDPYCHLQHLLRLAATRIVQPEDCGFRPQPAFAGQSLAQLRDDVEQAFLELSVAHYDRYLAPGIVSGTSTGASGLTVSPENPAPLPLSETPR